MNWIKQLIDKYHRFLSFGIVGAINTILSQVLYMVFVYFDWLSVSMASIIADCLTMILSYILNMKYTYHKPLSIQSALSYPIAYIPGVLFTSVVTTIVAYYGVEKIWAKAICLPITIIVNYFLVSLMVKITSKKEEKQ